MAAARRGIETVNLPEPCFFLCLFASLSPLRDLSFHCEATLTNTGNKKSFVETKDFNFWVSRLSCVRPFTAIAFV